MQHRIVKPSKLLNKSGELIQKGYALSPILRYYRKDVARKFRLKEWDYYLIYNEDYAVALTVGYSINWLLLSASFIDFKNIYEKTKSLVRFVSKKRFKMPQSSVVGDIFYQDQEVMVDFNIIDGSRSLLMKIKNFDDGRDFMASFVLSNKMEDSMNIATPFPNDKKAFYYNRKIIGMQASGMVRFKGKSYEFSSLNSYGILDWGRGVWPYKTTWYWAAGQGTVWGNKIGFNLGYGFGDTSAATENMLFFNAKASKLNHIKFHIPKNDRNQYEYMQPWIITSSDHRFEMKFEPIIDRNAHLNAIILSTHQHQVFGKFTGSAILDDGTIIYLKDFLGFAERVENRW